MIATKKLKRRQMPHLLRCLTVHLLVRLLIWLLQLLMQLFWTDNTLTKKNTTTNLFRNADISDDVKGAIQDESPRKLESPCTRWFCSGCFQSSNYLGETDTHWEIVDGIVDGEADQIIEMAVIGSGMFLQKKTVRY